MPTKTDMPDRWYSTKEICAYLGISRDTMLVWISTKNMPRTSRKKPLRSSTIVGASI